MDTTPIYCKMCEKAVEIQLNFMPDFNSDDEKYSFACVNDALMRCNNCEIDYAYFIKHCPRCGTITNLKPYQYITSLYEANRLDGGDIIWIPRQDQLQEILNQEIYYKVWNFYEFVMGEIEPRSDKSMEQLWLAFVMREKYSKQWSQLEQDWV